MGYYTIYSGAIDDGPDWAVEEAMNWLENDEDHYWTDVFVDPGNLAMKWYEFRNDCIELSKRFPAVLFSLVGEGEDSGDIWKAWFRNGKAHVVKARIVFDDPNLDEVVPPPDVEKMQEQRREKLKQEYQERLRELHDEYKEVLNDD